ncbi:MAG TPA: ribose-phosphate pyrophosphokinase [Chlamydiales bacterium]|nr:ribose-phosphate pyrophosphokinase [Chlamydiales bacterium]
MTDEPSFVLFAGSSHETLAEAVARALKVGLGKVEIETFPDGEIGIQILENVRGKDTFVLQSPARHPNHFLMEMFIMVDALKRASARSVVAVLPYYPYARQDRKDKGRVPITAKLVADLLERAGVTRVLAMDLHTDQIQGFFNIPVDNLHARPLFIHELQTLGLKDMVIVSPDVGSNRMARKFAEDLQVDLAIVDKRRVSARAVEPDALIGEVRGKHAILVDDICSTGATLAVAAKVCRMSGAQSVYAAVTHGLFVNDQLPSGIDRFFVTDSVIQSKALENKIETVSIASYIAEVIDCVISAKSISSLFAGFDAERVSKND